MKILLLVLIAIYILAFVVTRDYGKSKITKLDKEHHKLHFLYGMAMFIADKPMRRLTINEGRRLEGSLKKLLGEDRANEKRYFYIVSKYATVLGILFLVLLFCLIFEMTHGVEYISSLSRNEYGMGEANYKLVVKTEDREKEVDVVVPEYEYSGEEAYKLMENYWEEVVRVMLGDNKSVDYVNCRLNFISSIGNEGIHINWDLNDTEYISFDGSINTNIPKEGFMVTVTATMSLQNYSAKKDISLCVFPPDNNGEESIIQDYIDNFNVNEKQISLPEKIADNSVLYHIASDNYSGSVLVFGIIISFMFFYLKDRDIKKDLSEREMQLRNDYPEIVNKIMLLVKAGLSMVNAWEKTLESAGDKTNNTVYKEMRIALTKVQSGMTETRAYEEFGRQCGVHCYIRFSNLINQNVKRGTSQLCTALEQELESALNEKKNAAIKRGEQIGTKLLMPVSALLAVSLVIIASPAFLSLNI